MSLAVFIDEAYIRSVSVVADLAVNIGRVKGHVGKLTLLKTISEGPAGRAHSLFVLSGAGMMPPATER